MLSRPKVIWVVALAQILAPVFNVLLSARASGLSVARYLDLIVWTEGAWHYYGSLSVPVLAGFAIAAVRPWSLPVFAVSQLWSILDSTKPTHGFRESWVAPLLVAAYAINIGVVAFLLVPGIRRYFLERKLRWWQSPRRYQVDWPAQLETEAETVGRVREISHQGVYVELEGKLGLGTRVPVRFESGGEAYCFPAVVVNRLGGSLRAHGMQFAELDRAQRKALRVLLTQLERQGFERRPERTVREKNRLARAA